MYVVSMCEINGEDGIPTFLTQKVLIGDVVFYNPLLILVKRSINGLPVRNWLICAFRVGRKAVVNLP